jgi:signal recognition particle subunit SRP54
MTMQKKFQEASFDFKDFLQQMRLIKRMGSLGGLIRMIPGMNKLDQGTIKAGEKQLKKIESVIGSMTNREREQPELLIKSQKRRNRIAIGSGHSNSEVDRIIQDFEKMKGMMRNLSKGNLGDLQNSMMRNKEDLLPTKTSEQQVFKKEKKNTVKKRKGFFEL